MKKVKAVRVLFSLVLAVGLSLSAASLAFAEEFALKVVGTSTANKDYPGELAVDGKDDTFWHVEWEPTAAPAPHWIVLDLGGVKKINELKYLNRQDGNPYGNITGYKIYVSTDNQNFTEVASGSWDPGMGEKNATFDPVDAQYVKLESPEDQLAAAANIKVIGEGASGGSGDAETPSALPQTGMGGASPTTDGTSSFMGMALFGAAALAGITVLYVRKKRMN